MVVVMVVVVVVIAVVVVVVVIMVVEVVLVVWVGVFAWLACLEDHLSDTVHNHIDAMPEHVLVRAVTQPSVFLRVPRLRHGCSHV